MNIICENNSVIIKDIYDFDAVHTFDCGQCFRWEREQDGSYTGIAHGRVVNISNTRDSVTIRNTTLEDVQSI